MKKLSERDADMLESIEMWLHEIEPKWVEKELAWLEQLRSRLLSEEPDKSLEEAAEEQARSFGYMSEDYEYKENVESFIAGAEWQKEQMMKDGNVILAEEDFDAEKEKSIEWGYNLCKQQMIKDAVEGRVFMSFAPGHNQMVMADVDLPTNTKVRVIVLKAEEE